MPQRSHPFPQKAFAHYQELFFVNPFSLVSLACAFLILLFLIPSHLAFFSAFFSEMLL